MIIEVYIETSISTLDCAEFIGEHSQRPSSNALGLQHTHTGKVVTIVAGSNTNRYRIQSNDPLSMTLVLEQLVARLESRYPGSYVASIGQNHLQLVQSQIEAHFVSRQRVKRIAVSILCTIYYIFFSRVIALPSSPIADSLRPTDSSFNRHWFLNDFSYPIIIICFFSNLQEKRSSSSDIMLFVFWP